MISMFQNSYNRMIDKLVVDKNLKEETMHLIYEEEKAGAHKNKHRQFMTINRKTLWMRSVAVVGLAGCLFLLSVSGFLRKDILNQQSTVAESDSGMFTFTVYAGEMGEKQQVTEEGVSFDVLGGDSGNMLEARISSNHNFESNFIAYEMNLSVEEEQVTDITYEFQKNQDQDQDQDQDQGRVATRFEYPEKLQDLYQEGTPATDAARKKENQYYRLLNQYCEEFGLLRSRFQDHTTNDYFMLQMQDNPYTVSVQEQPEHLVIMLGLQNWNNEKKEDNGEHKLSEELNQAIQDITLMIRVTCKDGTQHTQNYRFRAAGGFRDVQSVSIYRVE